jgi:hypothetical protein
VPAVETEMQPWVEGGAQRQGDWPCRASIGTRERMAYESDADRAKSDGERKEIALVIEAGRDRKMAEDSLAGVSLALAGLFLPSSPVAWVIGLRSTWR